MALVRTPPGVQGVLSTSSNIRTRCTPNGVRVPTPTCSIHIHLLTEVQSMYSCSKHPKPPGWRNFARGSSLFIFQCSSVLNPQSSVLICSILLFTFKPQHHAGILSKQLQAHQIAEDI